MIPYDCSVTFFEVFPKKGKKEKGSFDNVYCQNLRFQTWPVPYSTSNKQAEALDLNESIPPLEWNYG
ncbi:unnamed protein product [Citrullus colocynthis]|uniref:Uncharacterized protein n=1 Tax=Citrullus colocynthis TaxID=252529 RepID=A0ABP0XZ69_9ROSI